jgi:hypothetical protein
LKKEILKDNRWCKIPFCVKRQAELILQKKINITKSDFHQNSNGIVHRNRKSSPKIHMEAPKTQNNKSNTEQDKQHCRYHITWLQIVLQNYRPTGHSWHMFIILASLEAEIRRIMVQSQTRWIVHNILSWRTQHKKGWWSGSRCVFQVPTPVLQKRKKMNKRNYWVIITKIAWWWYANRHGDPWNITKYPEVIPCN